MHNRHCKTNPVDLENLGGVGGKVWLKIYKNRPENVRPECFQIPSLGLLSGVLLAQPGARVCLASLRRTAGVFAPKVLLRSPLVIKT